VRCLSETSPEYAYSFLAADRSPIESGTLITDAIKEPPIVDFRPSAGAARLGLWDIVSETLQLNLGAPGSARPTSLAGASTYTTR
jgi:hypothetical protein